MRARTLAVLCLLSFGGCVSDEQRMAANQFAGHLSAGVGGLAGKVGYVAAGAMGEGAKSFNVHGRWCGKGFPSDDALARNVRAVETRGGVPTIYVKRELMPIDEVDLACARHDICYLMVDGAPQKARRADCDLILMCDMYEIPRLGKPELVKPSGLVLGWVGGSSWTRLSSDCNALGYRRIKPIPILPEV